MPGRDAEEGAAGLANVLVVVALVAMLLGAVWLIAARVPYAVDVEPGEGAHVVAASPAPWEVAGRTITATLSSAYPGTLSGNVTLYANESASGRNEQKSDFVAGQVPDWALDAEPGSAWTLEVTNHANSTVRVSGSVVCTTCFWTGGVLVGIGVLGFVFYRVGMRRA